MLTDDDSRRHPPADRRHRIGARSGEAGQLLGAPLPRVCAPTAATSRSSTPATAPPARCTWRPAGWPRVSTRTRRRSSSTPTTRSSGSMAPRKPCSARRAWRVLLSATPRLVDATIRGWNGVYAHEVADIFRPGAGGRDRRRRREPALLPRRRGERLRRLRRAASGTPIDFDAFFAANIYHVPFGGLAAARAPAPRAPRDWASSKAEAERALGAQVPAVADLQPPHGRRLRRGHVRGAGRPRRTMDPLAAGDRIGIYSYGSGSCAEFYSATLCPKRSATVAPAPASPSSCRAAAP